MTTPQQLDPHDAPYDVTWFDSHGNRCYAKEFALGGGSGPALWSDVHYLKPVCGRHLVATCMSCGSCTVCDRCHCDEEED